MALNAAGDLFIADRGNSRIRKIAAGTGIITTVAGSTDGFSGDGGPATAAQLSGPISIFIDNQQNLVIGDNQNDIIRKVDMHTGIITAIAGAGPHAAGSGAEGVAATAAHIHPEFIYIDLNGNIYYTQYGDAQTRKITNYVPGWHGAGGNCGVDAVSDITDENNNIVLYPNPATDRLSIKVSDKDLSMATIYNSLGQKCMNVLISSPLTEIDISALPCGIFFCVLSSSARDLRIVRSFTK